MAVVPRLQSLAGRWQIPLLAVSVGLFVAGLLQMRPAVREVTVDDIIRAARVDLQAERFEQASGALTTLLNEKELKNSERAQAHRLLAETIWSAESGRQRHVPENARRILANFEVGQQLGAPVQGADLLKVAQAADWLGDAEKAVEAYGKVLDAGVGDRPSLLQRLIEIQLAAPNRDWDKIDGYIDQLLADARGQPDTLLRVVQWKMQRLFSQDDIEGVKALLKSVEGNLDVPPWSYHLQCFQAQILFREEQYEAAEGRLRALQGGLRRSDSLYAQAGWLLGRINYIEGRPEIALSFYDEVIRTQAGSEYWLASLVGKAEALAALQRYTASAESYRRAVESLRQYQGSLLIDEQAIRQSLRTLATVLSQADRPEEALPFAEMATVLMPEEQTGPLGDLVEQQAQIHVQAANDLQRAQHEGQSPPVLATAEQVTNAAATAPASEPVAGDEAAPEDSLSRARRHLADAGDLYARLAKIRVLQAPLAQEASWQSARCFDQAGSTDKALEALEAFIREYPSSEYAPEAMHRLGASLQAQGRIDEAIGVYEDLLAKFERTQAAFASLVPLGRCHIELGPPHYNTAEKVLLSIVEEDPAQPPLFTPSAPEFREGLLELANLYMRWAKPERAIERLEQAVSLYSQDPEITRMQYQLADAYRRSGVALQAEAAGMKQPTQGDALAQEAQRRLARAKDLFDKVASRLDVASAPLSPAERIYLKTSYVYRADCAFDTGQFGQAADLYGRVAWRWQNDPIALAAYVQIVRSYLATGEPDAARSALARARWILRKIPDAQFNQPPDFRTRAYWTQMFDWVEKSGLLAKGGG
jgi:tetratricopeptide (TPR) repeat protein